MGDDEDVAAEDRAYHRRFPFMMTGGLILLLGLGLIGLGLDKWPYTAGAVAIGVAIIAAGEWLARQPR